MFIILEWTRNKNDEYCVRIAQQVMGNNWNLPIARITKEQNHREYFRNISAPRYLDFPTNTSSEKVQWLQTMANRCNLWRLQIYEESKK